MKTINFILIGLLISAAHASMIASGESFTCALNAKGQVRCWGSNDFGQLGIDSTVAKGDSLEQGHRISDASNVSLGTKALMIGAGQAHACALLEGGGVKCWGRNILGQLGQDDEIPRGNISEAPYNMTSLSSISLGGAVKHLAVGANHNCVVLVDGKVKCWGLNHQGQLGQDNTTTRGNSTVLSKSMAGIHNVNLGFNAVAVAAGEAHSCALSDAGKIKCWGGNNYGQLGVNDKIMRGISTTSPNNMGSVVYTDISNKAIAITAAGNHSCALLEAGAVRCWGYNRSGQLGQDNTTFYGSSMENSVQVSSLISFGAGIQSIAAGSNHTCAILNSGLVKCWGANSMGQLGQNDTKKRGASSEYGIAEIKSISFGGTANSISAGYGQTCVSLINNGGFKCWGYNQSGQLGQNDTINRGDTKKPPYNVENILSINF